METEIEKRFNDYKKKGYNCAFAVLTDNFEFLVTPAKIIANDHLTKKLLLDMLNKNIAFHSEDTFMSFEIESAMEKLPETNLLFDFKFASEPQFFLS